MNIWIFNRIYADYFMPSRLEDYERLIIESLDSGFKHITIMDFFKLMKDNNQVDFKKYFIHRHDIDSDIKTAKKMFEIEKKYNIYCSPLTN